MLAQVRGGDNVEGICIFFHCDVNKLIQETEMRLINQLFLYFMVLVALQACTESNQEIDTQAANSQENVRDIATTATAQKAHLTAEEARAIAKDAYMFGFAFVANYRVFIAPLLEKKPSAMGAGPNEFVHMRDLFPPETRDTTQRDTVFSLGIIDLRREPVVVSVPDVPDGQVYMLQMGDTSTESLPYISTATTNNKAGDYVLVGPDFQGFLLADKFDGVITTRGQFVVMLGRTVLFDPNDLSPVHAIQDGMQMRPLSGFMGTEPPLEPAPLSFVPWDDERAAGLGVFDYINMALAWHPPAIHEFAAMASFAKIGVIPGQPFSTDGLSTDIIAAIEEGIADARQDIKAWLDQPPATVGSWFWSTVNFNQFGNDYLARAAVSLKTIYPNSPEHAIYGQASRDADGQRLTGQHVSTLRFAGGKLPPVNWFWSVTMYDSKTTAMYPNDAERYNVGDRTSGLVYGDDGSLTIYMSHEAPDDPSERANWLPAPAGEYNVVLRLYGAKPEVSDGKWTPPPIIRKSP